MLHNFWIGNESIFETTTLILHGHGISLYEAICLITVYTTLCQSQQDKLSKEEATSALQISFHPVFVNH